MTTADHHLHRSGPRDPYALDPRDIRDPPNAVFLMGVAVATLYLSRTQTDARVQDGPFFFVMLVISAVSIVGVGVVGLVNLF